MTVRSVALPTEHGGWGFTIEPILLGLLVAPSATGWELAVVSIAVFLARRPLKLVSTDLVRRRWLGRSTTALAVAAAYGFIAMAGFVGAFVTHRGAFWWPLVVAVPLAAISLRADARSRNRGLLPQLSGAIAMGSTVAAMVMGAGWGWVPSFGLWGVLAARDVAAIVLARGMVRRFKVKTVRNEPILAVVPWLSVAAMALLGVTAVISLRLPPVPARVVGWTQIGVGLVVVVMTAVGSRLGI
jgi:hypothetical protein